MWPKSTAPAWKSPATPSTAAMDSSSAISAPSAASWNPMAISRRPRCATLFEQATALVDAGADAIIIETQTSLEELLLGIHAAREAGAPTIIGSMAYDVTLDGSTFRTMMRSEERRVGKEGRS